jgi:hypothetical protein
VYRSVSLANLYVLVIFPGVRSWGLLWRKENAWHNKPAPPALPAGGDRQGEGTTQDSAAVPAQVH